MALVLAALSAVGVAGSKRPLVERARGRATKLRSLNEARDRFDREYLLDLMRMTSGSVSEAARLAGRNRSEFCSLLGRHEIDPAQFRRTIRDEDPYASG